jgi:PadR family transcriptional regulator PadR
MPRARDPQPKMTLQTQLVLGALLEDPAAEMYGLEICAAAGLPSGTISPMLRRLEDFGWVTSRWEEVDPAEEGRARRRFYRINPNSISTVQAALARAEQKTQKLQRLRPHLAGGGA